MPASELEEWRVFCQFEPLPDPFWVGAQICSVIANVNRAKGPAFKAEDFVPVPSRPNRRQTPDEMVAAFRAAAGGGSSR